MFVVHRAESGAVLAEELARLLADPLDDPFAPEIVSVPAKGVERWLTQRLSLRLGAINLDGIAPKDGVCANVDFPSPRQLFEETVALSSPALGERLAMWAPPRLTWSVLAALDDNLNEDWCRLPRQYLFPNGAGDDDAPDRRLGFAARVARLFDTYAHSRPEMLARWANDEYVLPDGSPVPASEQWQPRLWRSALNMLGGTSPVDLHTQLVEEVRTHPERVALPRRLSVFAPSRVTRRDLEMFHALAEHRDVHIWLHHSSPALWESVSRSPVAVRRSEDATSVSNPLLRSLSRDVRELQMMLRAYAPGHMSVHHPPPSRSENTDLLRKVRSDLAADVVPESRAALGTSDRSVQVHACHGRTRQVEVLREVVVGLLADDPTLEPRDVLVMCPDIETFAPLLSAVFAPRSPGDETHPAEQMRVHIADRALHQSNPVLAVLDALLEFGTARHTANEVLGFAELSAVARRFRWDDQTREQLREWTRASNVRWGLNDADRSQWQLSRVTDGTWRSGMDRLLLGAAFDAANDDTRPVAQLLPSDDIDSADLDLLGRFTEFLDRVDATQSLLTQPHTAAEWADILQQATTGLTLPDPDAPWQALQLRELLQEVLVDNAGGTGANLMLTLREIRPALREALAGRPTRAGFRTGALTVCELVPMRSVPHRVVILLGLDDGAFPRQSARDGDDLLARDPWIGDRDPRSEDRQLFLDAIGAAGERLVVIYTGHDQRTGAPMPPAVPLGELLDALDRTAIGPDGRSARDTVTTHHPLQPFDARAFIAGALGTDRPFSFDPRAHAGATSATQDRSAPPLLTDTPLPALPPADVELEDLVALLCHPARGFLRQRLQISTTEVDEGLEDSLPLELTPLERWALGGRVLRELLTGSDTTLVRERELARGNLPPGPLGTQELSVVGPRAEAIAHAADALLAEEAESYDIDVDLGDGTRLLGTVNNVRGSCLTGIGYGALTPRQRLSAWLRLLALTATLPNEPWRAITLGLDRDRAQCARSTLQAVDEDVAGRLLRQYVSLYRDGLQAPLPLSPRSSEAYAARRFNGTPPQLARSEAARQWNDAWNVPGEQSDDAHALLFGSAAPFDVLLRDAASIEDYFQRWPSDEEGDRFGVLSRRLWGPLLRYETRDTV
ncbi:MULTISPECIES: exodeoxyribonuclease V subunit gamma [unclassified Microbacterium]|uniref:exodeoxyribonuclease V subunit gamma n=1 Tax=unclassified Microbacterium TaxID=2609290 RepID=UPI00300F8D54